MVLQIIFENKQKARGVWALVTVLKEFVEHHNDVVFEIENQHLTIAVNHDKWLKCVGNECSIVCHIDPNNYIIKQSQKAKSTFAIRIKELFQALQIFKGYAAQITMTFLEQTLSVQLLDRQQTRISMEMNIQKISPILMKYNQSECLNIISMRGDVFNNFRKDIRYFLHFGQKTVDFRHFKLNTSRIMGFERVKQNGIFQYDFQDLVRKIQNVEGIELSNNIIQKTCDFCKSLKSIGTVKTSLKVDKQSIFHYPQFLFIIESDIFLMIKNFTSPFKIRKQFQNAEIVNKTKTEFKPRPLKQQIINEQSQPIQIIPNNVLEPQQQHQKHQKHQKPNLPQDQVVIKRNFYEQYRNRARERVRDMNATQNYRTVRNRTHINRQREDYVSRRDYF